MLSLLHFTLLMEAHFPPSPTTYGRSNFMTQLHLLLREASEVTSHGDH